MKLNAILGKPLQGSKNAINDSIEESDEFEQKSRNFIKP